MSVRTPACGLLLMVCAMLGGCNEKRPVEAPTDSTEVEQRALEAQTARRRTGAEIQERALNRTVRAVYLCANGERLTVDFDNPRQMATVRNSNGMAVDLYQQRAASGIWYTASGHDLRGKGNEAIWTADEAKPTDCRAVD